MRQDIGDIVVKGKSKGGNSEVLQDKAPQTQKKHSPSPSPHIFIPKKKKNPLEYLHVALLKEVGTVKLGIM